MFPIELPTNWQLANNSQSLAANKGLKSWVCSESSLTVKIKELGTAFSVEVLNQCYQAIDEKTQQQLNTKDSVALIREVLLKQGDKPLIYAQTIIPESTIVCTESRLAELGNQSLGQVLFQSKETQRGHIEVSTVSDSSALGSFIQNKLGQALTDVCFIRRSTFNLNNKPLIVNECFLPLLTNGSEE